MPVKPQEFLSAADAAKLALLVGALHEESSVRLKVRGVSMLPTLRPGDILTIQGWGAPPEIGDMVLAVREGRCFVHRLTQRRPDAAAQWVTRGDAMAAIDPPFEREQLLGKVVARERAGRVKEVVPLSFSVRAMGWLLCRSAICRNLILILGRPRSSVYEAESQVAG